MAKTIKEMSKDALTKFEPALRCSHTPDGEKIEHYTWSQMLSMYELGANAALEEIESILDAPISYVVEIGWQGQLNDICGMIRQRINELKGM